MGGPCLSRDYEPAGLAVCIGVVVSSLLTPAEAAVEARCSRHFIYEALLTGELPGIQRKKPKGRWLIEAEALSRWVRGM